MTDIGDNQGWEATLRYCEKQWTDERAQMLRMIAAKTEALVYLEREARRFAAMYAEGTDGRNTFNIFADKIASRAAVDPLEDDICTDCGGAPEPEDDWRCPNCGEDEIDGARCHYCGYHNYNCGFADCEKCTPTPQDKEPTI